MRSGSSIARARQRGERAPVAHPRGVSLLLLALGAQACAAERNARPLRADADVPAELALQTPDPDEGYVADFYAGSGLMLQARSHHMWLTGDFDGDTTLTGPDTIVIPDADEGDGYEVALGVQKEGDAFLISYTHADFDGSIGGLDADVEYTAFALEVMHFLRANERLEPYLYLGLLYPMADLDDASTDGVDVGDAKLRGGFGGSFGAGLAWWIDRRLAFDVRAYYTYQWFTEAEGVAGDSESIDEDVDVPSYGISFGLSWVPGWLR